MQIVPLQQLQTLSEVTPAQLTTLREQFVTLIDEVQAGKHSPAQIASILRAISDGTWRGIHKSWLQLPIGGHTKEAIMAFFDDADIGVGEVSELAEKTEFPTSVEPTEFVCASPKEFFGLTGETNSGLLESEIFLNKHGLTKCKPYDAFYLRAAFMSQSKNGPEIEVISPFGKQDGRMYVPSLERNSSYGRRISNREWGFSKVRDDRVLCYRIATEPHT